jgi:hypothetical protein
MTRAITITPVLNGFLIAVGCQQVVFTDKQSMLAQLSEYYDNPDQVEKRFIERGINKTFSNLPLQPAPPPNYPEPVPCGLAASENRR